MLFEQKKIKLLDKWHFVENKTKTMQRDVHESVHRDTTMKITNNID